MLQSESQERVIESMTASHCIERDSFDDYGMYTFSLIREGVIAYSVWNYLHPRQR